MILSRERTRIRCESGADAADLHGDQFPVPDASSDAASCQMGSGAPQARLIPTASRVVILAQTNAVASRDTCRRIPWNAAFYAGAT